jgi:GTPase SAR1 family protein
LYSIITMIKLILIAFLCFALNGPVYGHSEEEEPAKPDCLTAGSAKIKLSINVPPGACGCPDDDDEDGASLCLGLENSQKISDAIQNIIKSNGDSYDVIQKLKLHRFMYGMEYNDFSANIKENDFDLVGFAELKELVEKYRICKKECKVYYTLRKSLRDDSASAVVEEIVNDDNTKTIVVTGNLVILGDAINEIQEKMVRDIQITGVTIKASTLIADANLMNALWHGKKLRIEASNLVTVASRVIDVSACMYYLSLVCR